MNLPFVVCGVCIASVVAFVATDLADQGDVRVAAVSEEVRPTPTKTRSADRAVASSQRAMAQQRRSPQPRIEAGSELQTELAAVRNYSQRRIAQLSKRLELSPSQRREVYPLIARSAPKFAVGMRINGVPTAPLSYSQAQQGIFDVLMPDQQDEFIDDALAESEWWQDFVADLEEELDASMVPTIVEEVDEQAGSNLFGP